MSITTFAGLAAAPNSQKGFLCVLNPRKRLQNWTKTGGQTYVYEIALTSIFEVSTEFGNTYRLVTSVEHNGTELDEFASIADVDSFDSSFYHDTSGSKLYIHTTDNSNPNSSSTYIIVFINLYFSSGIGKDGKGKIFSNIYYEPLFNPANIPAITYEQTDLLAGGGLKTGSVTLEFNNTHKFWNTIWKEYSWKNADFSLYYGGEELPLTEYELIYFGTIKKESWTERKVWFSTTNYIDLLKRNVPVTPIFGANVAAADSGKPLPLAFGTLTGITPLLTDESVADDKEYTIADAAFQTLKAIDAIYDGVTDVTTDATADLTNCKFTFNSYTPSGKVTCDVRGAKISDITGESSTDLMINASDIIRFFLKEILLLPDAKIESTSFAAAKVDNVAPLCKYLRYRRNLSSYIAEIERSILGNLFINNSGQFEFDIYEPTQIEDDSIINEELGYFKESSPISKIYTGLKIYYDPKPYDRYDISLEGEEDSYEVLEDTNSRARYVDKQTIAFKHIYTWLKEESDAQNHLYRLLLLTDAPYVEVDAHIKGINLFQRKPGDILKVSKTIAPSSTGNYDEEGFQIVRIIKEITQQQTIVLLDNFKGLSIYLGMWTSDTAPDYTTATEDEKKISGFWCDGDGLAETGNYDSYNNSVWW